MKSRLQLNRECLNQNIESKARMLGYAALIIFDSRLYSNCQIAAMKLWLNQAIEHRQIKFFFDNRSYPLGYVTWAHFAADSEWNFMNNPDFILHPSEWDEGDRTWIIDFCFPRGGVAQAVLEIRNFFKDEGLKKVSWARRDQDYKVMRFNSFNFQKRN